MQVASNHSLKQRNWSKSKLIKFDLKVNFKRFIGKLKLKIMMPFIAYFVQFNKFFQEIYIMHIFDDFCYIY